MTSYTGKHLYCNSLRAGAPLSHARDPTERSLVKRYQESDFLVLQQRCARLCSNVSLLAGSTTLRGPVGRGDRGVLRHRFFHQLTFYLNKIVGVECNIRYTIKMYQ